MVKRAARTAQRELGSDGLVPLDRMTFLVDGVFAITLTLLVLDLRVSDAGSRALADSLTAMLPRLAIYLFAFASIGNQWVIHHRTFRLVKHGDSSLVMLSLLNLLFITLIPASAAIVGAYPTQKLAAACSAINNLLLCLSAAALWAYVARHRDLLAEDANPRILEGIALVWILVAGGFVVGLMVGSVSVYAEYAVWVAWSPFVTMWWERRRRVLAAGPT